MADMLNARSSVNVKHHENGNIWLVERFLNGVKHSVDYPAFEEWSDKGHKIKEGWFLNGEHHKVDEPAYIEWNSSGDRTCEFWLQNSKFHRLDGPAKLYYLSGKVFLVEWYIDGCDVIKKDHPEIDFENWPLSVEDQIKLKLIYG